MNNLKKMLVSLAVVTLAVSCTTFEDIDGGLKQFRGQPIDSLINVLGFPDGERTVAGRKLIYWSSNRDVTTTTPVTNYNYGTASAYGSGGYAYGNYSGTTTTYVPTTVNYNCTLKVQIDQRNRILGHDFEGNIGGCERYAAALRPYLPKKE
tara:strand:+ start:149 stop:601 length:453 start_codon:yes stop_codon:yes gene_type:complete